MTDRQPAPDSHAVFLSYAHEDRVAAQRIAEALIAGGIEVWFDQSELRGADAWDAKIKKQIRGCALFIPVISSQTQARAEGYFRREWNLATQRLLDMAPGRPFLVPVVIDATAEKHALVAEEFLHVQWSRFQGGEVNPTFVARVKELLGSRTPIAEQAFADPGPTPAPSPARRRPRRGAWGWLAAVALLVGGLLWLGLHEGWLGTAGRSGLRQLAVLPFNNIGTSPHTRGLGEGLSETITAQLNQLQQFQNTLLVIPMSEVRKESVETASEARKVFGATLALTGSVQREENTLRVTVSLIDTRTLRILRSATLDHPTNELYRLQDRVAAQTAGWLGLELSADARRVLSAGETKVAPAYELYLQGRGKLARHDLPGNLDAAILHLQQALAQDPTYALAHAALGEAFWQRYSETNERSWLAEARRSCRAALEHGAALASPHVTLAVILVGTGDYEDAVAEAQTALRLDPANANASRILARAYARLNRPAEAEATFQRVIERHPESSLANSDLAVFYYVAGRYAEAERHFLRVAELIPDNYAVYRNLGGLCVVTGRPAQAAAYLEKSIALKPSAGAYSNLGSLRFQQERYADAARLFEQAAGLAPRNHMLLGNLADALRHVPVRAAEAGLVYERAIRLTEEFLQVNPKAAEVWASLALYCAFTGKLSRAHEAIAQARSLAPASLPIMINAALVSEQAGQRDQALSTLALALEAGYARAHIDDNPDLKGLRADPGFASLVSRAGKAREK